MARGRIISKAISTSRKVSEVSDQAALLFSWVQPHTDDYGRIEGGADDVLFSVVPRRNWSEEQVESYLKELYEKDLVKVYHDKTGKRYVEVVDFDQHQTFRSDRDRKEKCPKPKEYDGQWYTKDTQREKIDVEVKLSTSKGKYKGKLSVGAKTRQAAPTTETIEAKPFTPKEKAQQFFEGVDALKRKEEVPWLQQFLNAIAQANKLEKSAIWNEIKAFASYWTELNPTGTKQRWQMQKTFEVERRLTTWFGRAGFRGFSTAGVDKKGKGIVGLDEDTENENL